MREADSEDRREDVEVEEVQGITGRYDDTLSSLKTRSPRSSLPSQPEATCKQVPVMLSSPLPAPHEAASLFASHILAPTRASGWNEPSTDQPSPAHSGMRMSDQAADAHTNNNTHIHTQTQSLESFTFEDFGRETRISAARGHSEGPLEWVGRELTRHCRELDVRSRDVVVALSVFESPLSPSREQPSATHLGAPEMHLTRL